MPDPDSAFGRVLTVKETARYFELNAMLFEFAKLFDFNEASDRAIAIVGPAFLDTLMAEALTNLFVDDEKEVPNLLQPDRPLGTYSSRISACFCLGLINEVVKADLRMVGKIRNRFAHDLRATFEDQQIQGWCKALRWHREAYMATPPKDAKPRDLFQVDVHQLVGYLHGIVSLAHARKCKPMTWTTK